jgi:hypothetical protein
VKSSGPWRVPREWDGEIVFVLGGGPSVLDQDLSLLKGHRVIAVNSGWRSYPDANILFFGDKGWWDGFGGPAKAGFAGRIVTIADGVHDDQVLKLRRVKPPIYLADGPDRVAMLKTSVTGAVNLACHLNGGAGVILLGVDLTFGADGRRHHHDDRYRRPPRPDWQRTHRAELEGQARALKQRGIPAINCSPVSEIAGWDNRTFEGVAKRLVATA